MNYKKILLISMIPIITCVILSIYIQSRYIQLSYTKERLTREYKKLVSEYEKIKAEISHPTHSSISSEYQPITLQQIYSLTDESCTV